jgi:hypothetical protein
VPRWRVSFSDDGWRDFEALSVIDREAVLDMLGDWERHDPPTTNPYNYGFTTRYREPVPTGYWVVFAVDTVVEGRVPRGGVRGCR